jgi:hypothetical protein
VSVAANVGDKVEIYRSPKRRFSSAVEQRFCKPKVGSSILSTGTTSLARKIRVSCSFGFVLSAHSVLQGGARRCKGNQWLTKPYQSLHATRVQHVRFAVRSSSKDIGYVTVRVVDNLFSYEITDDGRAALKRSDGG